MKLEKTKNKHVFYCFGNKESSLAKIKRQEESIFIGENPIALSDMVMAEQTHSKLVYAVTASDKGHGFTYIDDSINQVDGFVTSEQGILLVIKTADCSPILCYDKRKNVIGALHSGREGTRKGIIKVLIEKMVKQYNCELADLYVMLGPAISGKHYQVDIETYNDFIESTHIEQEYRHIDMRKVLMSDLKDMGLKRDQIEDIRECTYSSQEYFSYRRDKTAERQLSVIGIFKNED